MGEISQRADRFVRSVFLKKGTPAAPSTPADKKSANRMERAAAARKKAVTRRKGY